MDRSDPFDSEMDGSDSSDSFSNRQLTAAEEEEDPLPTVEGLQISGEALPGRSLQACGYSINGTIRCFFAWLRYSEHGTPSYIEGAKKACYLVTADDVGSCLAMEVIPVDSKGRGGELVRIFANEQRKISCDLEMQEQIERIFFIGHALFDVSMLVRCQDRWDKAKLVIKREGFSINCSAPLSIVVEEKFSPSTAIMIPVEHDTGFLIHSAKESDYLLKTADNSSLRDTIVLTMRLFIVRAAKKQKRRKRCLFF